MSKPRVPQHLRRSVWAMLRDGVEPGMIAFHTGVGIAAIKRMHFYLKGLSK